MGYEKDRQIEQDEQGWKFCDGMSICHRCISDLHLKQMAKDRASKHECTFCVSRSPKTPNSIPFNHFMEVYAGALFQYYNHVENEAMAYDSEDGEYVGDTYDTWDLVKDVIGEPSENEAVVTEIIDSLGDHLWCEKSPYSLGDFERYQYSWEEFCKKVKHEVRYFFDSLENDNEYSEKIPVPRMLDELSDLIDEVGLIGTLPVGTRFFRVRVHTRSETCDSWRSLGSPPPEVCVSNRMSAGGISVFYAGMDIETAKAETTANLELTERKILTGAMWTNTRILNILDLSKLPPVPSFFAQVRYDRDRLLFLRDFVESITQPVSHDGREHTEYVPTQILTEYFRHRYRLPDHSQLDAIVYPSARRKNGRSVVIFASQEDLSPRPSEWWNKRTPLLVLDPAQTDWKPFKSAIKIAQSRLLVPSGCACSGRLQPPSTPLTSGASAS